MKIVVGDGREMPVEYVNLSVDGQEKEVLKTGECIQIQKDVQTVKVIKLSNVSFLETLRVKMNGK